VAAPASVRTRSAAREAGSPKSRDGGTSADEGSGATMASGRRGDRGVGEGNGTAMAAGRGVGADRQDLGVRGEDERAVESEKARSRSIIFFSPSRPRPTVSWWCGLWRGKRTPTGNSATA